MSRLIDADKLEPDTEWNDYDDDFVSYSQSQIRNAEEIQAIPLDKVNQARLEISENMFRYSGSGNEVTQAYCDGFKDSLKILDKLIAESEGKND
jgi:hypothetical protein